MPVPLQNSCSAVVLDFLNLSKQILVIKFEVLTAVVMKCPIAWDITLCSLLKINTCFGGTCRLQLQGRRISPPELATNICFIIVLFLAYCLTLKMEVTSFSETSVHFQRTTGRYIPEERTANTGRPIGHFLSYFIRLNPVIL
jgi:hypothetical protein